MKFIIPEKGRLLRWLLALLGTILIGAIGSGVWQSLLGPALHLLRNSVLDLASLGFRSYKDSIYRQIAADNPLAVNVETLYIVTLVYALVGFSILAVLARTGITLAAKNQDLHRKILRDLGRKPTSEERPKRSLEELEADVMKAGESIRRWRK